MSIENIKENILELYQNTPENVGVMFGKKSVNGQFTDENCIVFTVEKKIPLSEIPESEVLPSVIEMNGVEYNTDVLEVGKFYVLQSCQPLIDSGCYEWNNNVIEVPFNPVGPNQRVGIPPNRNTIRPLQQGISVTSTNHPLSVGTLGFFAIDNATNSIVGVSNNHVLIGNAFYTSERGNITTIIENEYFDSALQSTDFRGVPSNEDKYIGNVLKYVPIKKQPEINYVDGALTTIRNTGLIASGLDNTTPKSWFFYGLTGLSNTVLEAPMEFATTSEIDNLMTNPPSQVWSVGRTTGVKQGPCALKIIGVGVATSVNGYNSQGVSYAVSFADLIGFTRLDNSCPYPIAPGDSGSALIAVINGKPKIIGLCFAGIPYAGLACRIDRVAQELDIKQWDGINNEYFDETIEDIFSVQGSSSDKILLCSGETYWQIGNTLDTLGCDCGTLKMTVLSNLTFFGFRVSGSGVFNMVVDWGDNSMTRYTGLDYYGPTHRYETFGEFIVRISVSDCTKITSFLFNGGTTQNPTPPYFNRVTNFEGFENFSGLLQIIISQGIITNFNPTVSLPQSLKTLSIGYCPLSSYVFSLPLPTGINTIALNNDGLNTNSVNNWLVYFDSFLPTNNSGVIQITQLGVAPPTGAGITAKNNLIARGWSVTTD
jgi:hypothetical protein